MSSDDDCPFDERISNEDFVSYLPQGHCNFQTFESMQRLSNTTMGPFFKKKRAKKKCFTGISPTHPWEDKDTDDEHSLIRTPPSNVIRRPRQLSSPPVPQRLSSWSLFQPTKHVRAVGPPQLEIYQGRLPTNLMPYIEPLLQAAIQYGKNNGWVGNLYSLTKQDLAVSSIPNGSVLCQPITEFIASQITTIYGRPIAMDEHQPHLLKYDGQHPGVQLHHDRCSVTANVVLSASNSYVGGGTMLPAANATLRLEQGGFILHPGCLVHGGKGITAGTRYLLVFFCHFQ